MPLQEGKALCSHLEQKEARHKDKDREEIPEPGPPSRPPISRLIGTPLTVCDIIQICGFYMNQFL